MSGGGASYEETKSRIRDRVRLIRDLVNRATDMPHMSQEDLTIAIEAVSSVEYGERILLRSLDNLHKTDAALAGDIAWAVDHLTGGTLIAASRTTLSKSALSAAAFRRAQEMRTAKADPDREDALAKAVHAALAGRDPNKRGISATILGQVNRQLKAAGYDEVDRFVVARRLKNVRS